LLIDLCAALVVVCFLIAACRGDRSEFHSLSLLQMRPERRRSVVAHVDAAASWHDGPASVARADGAQVAVLAAAASTERLAAIIQAMSDGPTDGEIDEVQHAASSLAAATAIVQQTINKQLGSGNEAVPKLAGTRRRSRSKAVTPGHGGSPLLRSSVPAAVAASVISEKPMMSVTSLSEIVCLPAPTDKLGVVGEPERPQDAEAPTSTRLHSLRQRLTSFLGRETAVPPSETPSSDGATAAPNAPASASLPAMGSVSAVSYSAAQLRRCTAPPVTDSAASPSSQQHPVACGGSNGSAYERLMVTPAPFNRLEVEQALQLRPAQRDSEDARRSTVTPGSSRRTSRTVRCDPATAMLLQPSFRVPVSQP